MSMTDILADMLTRIRNGQKAKLLFVSIPYSKMRCNVLDILINEGYVASYVVSDVRSGIKNIDLKLRYDAYGNAAIKEIIRVSKPGKRFYTGIKDLKDYYNGMGVYVLSTSRGIMSDKQAKKLRVGGEVICKVF